MAKYGAFLRRQAIIGTSLVGPADLLAPQRLLHMRIRVLKPQCPGALTAHPRLLLPLQIKMEVQAQLLLFQERLQTYLQATSPKGSKKFR